MQGDGAEHWSRMSRMCSEGEGRPKPLEICDRPVPAIPDDEQHQSRPGIIEEAMQRRWPMLGVPGCALHPSSWRRSP